MAVTNWINYAAIPPQKSGLADLFANVLKGYQMEREPTKIRQQEMMREFENQLKQQQAQYYGPNIESEMALRGAQIGKLNREAEDPYAGQVPPGAVGQAWWLQQLKERYGEDSPVVQDAIDNIKTARASQESTANRNRALTESLAYRSLPMPVKNQMVATAVGMGMDPAAAAQMLASGATLDQMADFAGIDLDNVTPVYPLANETIKQLQNRRAFISELEQLNKNITEGLAPYSEKAFGFSPKQIAEAIKGENPDKQAKFLAARALSPELSALRLKSAGANVGIEAIRDMTEKSLQKSRVFESMVTPEVYERMNNYIDKWVAGAGDIYNKTLLKQAQYAKKQMESGKPERPADLEPSSRKSSTFDFSKYKVRGK